MAEAQPSDEGGDEAVAANLGCAEIDNPGQGNGADTFGIISRII